MHDRYMYFTTIREHLISLIVGDKYLHLQQWYVLFTMATWCGSHGAFSLLMTGQSCDGYMKTTQPTHCPSVYAALGVSLRGEGNLLYYTDAAFLLYLFICF